MRGRGADRHPDGWSDAVQRLIGAGHSYASIMDYTLAQTEAFLTAINRQESRHLANLLTVISTGSQGSSESLRKLFREFLC